MALSQAQRNEAAMKRDTKVAKLRQARKQRKQKRASVPVIPVLPTKTLQPQTASVTPSTIVEVGRNIPKPPTRPKPADPAAQVHQADSFIAAFGKPTNGSVEINGQFFTVASVEALFVKDLIWWKERWAEELADRFFSAGNWQARQRGLTVDYFIISSVDILRQRLTEQDISLIAKMLLRLGLQFATSRTTPNGDPRVYIQEADGWDEPLWNRGMEKWLPRLTRTSSAKADRLKVQAAKVLPPETALPPPVPTSPRAGTPKAIKPPSSTQPSAAKPSTAPTDEVIPELEMPDLYQALGGGVIEQLNITDIGRNPDQPRTYFSETELVAFGHELQTIQIQPILVTANPSGSPKYLLVDGERRWRACTLVGKKTLWGVRVEIADPNRLFLTSFFANEHRQPLNPLDEARAFHRIVAGRMMSVARLADRLNRSTVFIYQRLALLKLTPDVQALLNPELPEGQRLGSYTAYQLSSIQDPTIQLKLAREIIEKKIGGTETGAYIRLRAGQEGVPRQRRGFSSRTDYRNLRTFLRLVDVKAQVFLSMPVSQVSAMFQHRDAAHLQQVIGKLEGTLADLNGLLKLLQEIAGGEKA